MGNKYRCGTCGKDLDISRFYKSRSELNKNGIMPYCKDCLNSLDLSDKKTLLDTLQKIDIPYIEKYWNDIYENNENKKSVLGKYIRTVQLHNNKSFKESDTFAQTQEILDKINNEINSKSKILENKNKKIENSNKEIKEVENELKKTKDELLQIEQNKKDIIELQSKWGTGFTPDMYIRFENLYNRYVNNIPNKSGLTLTYLQNFVKFQAQCDKSISENDVDSAKKWGDLALKAAKQANITPEQFNEADLSQGIDSFSKLIREVESAVDIIPILPKVINKPQDKADEIILVYLNYERHLHNLDPVEYKDIYNFYNDQIEDFLKEKPNTYNFLNDERVKGNTPIERVFSYVFDVAIPKIKEENPNNSFYQNLDKWVEFVSYLRWYPDIFYDLISKKEKSNEGNTKHSLDQRVVLRGMARFKHFHGVLSRGSGKCVVGDTLLFTDNGIQEIGEFFDYQDNNIETIKEQPLFLLNRYGKLELSPRGIYSGLKKTKKITTQFGYEIECTLNHKLLVNTDRADGYKWLEANYITDRNTLLLSKKNNVFGKEKLSSIEEIDFIIDNIKNIHKLDKKILKLNKKDTQNFIDRLFKKCEMGYSLNNISYDVSKQIQIILLNLGYLSRRDKNTEDKYDLCILEKIKNIDLYYIPLPIVKIEDSENHTYDVYMSATNSFVGNGIINHNTFLNQEFSIHSAIFYPDNLIAVSAQTKDNSASLISAKFKEIVKIYPMLENEFYPAPKSSIDSKTNVLIKFKSGSELDNLVNAQSSKGQRRRRLIIEESAQINNKLFADVLEPIPNVARKTIGKMAIDSPVEMHGQIHFFTTSWYRGSSEFERCLKFFEDMVNLKGTFIIGAGYELNILAERGETKSAILSKRDDDPLFFALNYESKWIGSTKDALVPISKVMELRVENNPELKRNTKSNDEYIMGVDIARSSKAGNNQSSIVIVKLKRKSDNTIQNATLVNLINYSSTKSFEELSIEIKKIKKRYEPKAIVIDINGVGMGVLDFLAKEQFDSETNENLGAFHPMNDPDWTNIEVCSEPIIYGIKAQNINKEIILNFQLYVSTDKLRLLKRKEFNNLEKMTEEEILEKVNPYVQTDLLIDELANLKLEISDDNRFKLKQITRRIDKDRYSALAYTLYYIKKYEDISNKSNYNVSEDYFFFN